MKYLVLFFLLYIIACTSNSNSFKVAKSNFPIDSIVKITKDPVDIVIIENINLEELPKIDLLFFTTYFEDLPVLNPKENRLEFEYQPNWYFFDHRDMGDKMMFSILGDNESGYTILYYLLFDKLSKKIISVNHLSSYEADGGYYTNEKLVWKKNRFLSYSVSGGYEDLNDSLIARFKDSSCLEYSLTEIGFVTKEIFTFSQKDTVNSVFH